MPPDLGDAVSAARLASSSADGLACPSMFISDITVTACTTVRNEQVIWASIPAVKSAVLLDQATRPRMPVAGYRVRSECLGLMDG